MHVEANSREETSNPARLVMAALCGDDAVECCFRRLVFIKRRSDAQSTYVSVHLSKSGRDGHIPNFACDIRAMQRRTRWK